MSLKEIHVAAGSSVNTTRLIDDDGDGVVGDGDGVDGDEMIVG